MNSFIPTLSYKKLMQFDGPSQLRNICKDVGFFYLEDHGLSKNDLQEILDAAKTLFDLSDSDKKQINISNSRQYRGYSQLGAETTMGLPDMKESFDLGPESHTRDIGQPYHILQGPNQWPAIEGWEDMINKYMKHLGKLGRGIMAAVAKGLDLDKDYFEPAFIPDAFAMMRFNHYPPQTGRPKMGISPHTDFGCLVLLLQDDIGGLEVKLKSGKWVGANPKPGCLLVNLGDMLEIWTNGQYVATEHRVINKSKDQSRYSVPFFFEPALDTLVEPIDSSDAISHIKNIDIKKIYGQHMLEAFQRSFPNQ